MSFQRSYKTYSDGDVVECDGQSVPCSMSGRGDTTLAELGTDKRLEEPL